MFPKGKSTVAILRPGGEVVASPFEVSHNPRELNELVTLMKSLDGDTKIVMEYTGNYYLPVALFLQKIRIVRFRRQSYSRKRLQQQIFDCSQRQDG